MFRTLSHFSRFFYLKGKILRLNFMKQDNIPSQYQPKNQNQKLKLSQYQKISEMKINQEVSLKQLQSSLQKNKNKISKQQLALNQLIRSQSKIPALFMLQKSKQYSFTPRNNLYLLSKALELRKVNGNDSVDNKLVKLVNKIQKDVNKLTPEDMIRFLFSLKKSEIAHQDYLYINGLINIFLRQFGQFTSQTNLLKQNELESFYVVSLETNIKLLHSLEFIHEVTGREFESSIVKIVRSFLFYFHRFSQSSQKEKGLQQGKFISCSFYLSFLRLADRYEMPAEIFEGFVKAALHQKQYLLKNPLKLFQLSTIIHTSRIARTNFRGKTIKKYSSLFNFHLYIYQILERPNQLQEFSQQLILDNIRNLVDLSEQETTSLNMNNLKKTSLQRILNYTHIQYTKYFSDNYNTQIEKDRIQKWVNEGNRLKGEFLGQILNIYWVITKNKFLYNGQGYMNLLKLCINNYSILSLHSRLVILNIGLKDQFQNIRSITDIFFSMKSKQNSQQKGNYPHFKKGIEADEYLKLLSRWDQILKIGKYELNSISEGCFLKTVFTRLANSNNLQIMAKYISQRIIADHSYLDLFIARYVKFSEAERSLSRQSLEKTQTEDFKRQLVQHKCIIQNQKKDKHKLSKYYHLKNIIRIKLKRTLVLFKFTISILEQINKKIGSNNTKITNSLLFKQLNFHLNESLKFLHYRELFTQQFFSLVNQIAYYQQKNEAFDEESEIAKILSYNKISKNEEDTKKGLYSYLQ